MNRHAAIAGFGLSLLAYAVLELQLRPDLARYTRGGVGLFPSPLGRLLGAAGPWPLVIADALAFGLVLGWVVARSASRADLACSLPLLVFLVPAGVDALGALCVVAFLSSSSSSWRTSSTAAAALVHPASAVVPLLELVRQRAGLALVAPVGLLLVGVLATPYRGLLDVGRMFAPAVLATVVAVGVCSVSGWNRIPRGELFTLAGLLVAVAAVRSTDHGSSLMYLRYGVPFALLGLAKPATRHTGEVVAWSERGSCGAGTGARA